MYIPELVPSCFNAPSECNLEIYSRSSNLVYTQFDSPFNSEQTYYGAVELSIEKDSNEFTRPRAQ